MAFVASKLLWIVLAPGNFLLLVIAAGVLRMIFGRGRKGLGLVALGTVGFLLCAILPLGAVLTSPLENRFPGNPALPGRIDGIVLLGGSVDAPLSQVRGQVVLGDAAGRVTETVLLARRFPEARVLVSGGDGRILPEGFAEATTTRALLVGLGVAPEQILLEIQSRNTYENAVMSYAVAQPEPEQNWILVTSAMHMPRAVGCFRRAGWRVIPYPVDYRTPPVVHIHPGFALAGDLGFIEAALREWLGLIAYGLLGRTDALIPAPEG